MSTLNYISSAANLDDQDIQGEFQPDPEQFKEDKENIIMNQTKIPFQQFVNNQKSSDRKTFEEIEMRLMLMSE